MSVEGSAAEPLWLVAIDRNYYPSVEWVRAGTAEAALERTQEAWGYNEDEAVFVVRLSDAISKIGAGYGGMGAVDEDTAWMSREELLRCVEERTGQATVQDRINAIGVKHVQEHTNRRSGT